MLSGDADSGAGGRFNHHDRCSTDRRLRSPLPLRDSIATPNFGGGVDDVDSVCAVAAPPTGETRPKDNEPEVASASRLAEVSQRVHELRCEVLHVADEYCANRKQLGRVLRSRRALQQQVELAEQDDCVADRALLSATEECHRWASEELPAMQDLLVQEAESRLSDMESERLRLQQLSEVQSRELENLSIRAAGLEAVEQQRRASTRSQQTVEQRLEELDYLQFQVRRECADYKREVRTLNAELALLRSGLGSAPDNIGGRDLPQ